MKRPGFLVLILFAGSGFAIAAETELATAKAEERLAQFVEELNLSDEQIEQMRPVVRSAFERQAAALMKHGISIEDGKPENKLSRRERRALRKDMQEERKKTHEAVSEILDDEQMKKYEELAAKRRDEMRSRARERSESR